MAIFLKNIAFHGIFLDAILKNDQAHVSKSQELVKLVTEGIKNGTARPLNSIQFNSDQVEQAFRYMASGRHIGKVVIKIRDEEPEKLILASPVELPVIPRTSCDPKKTYIVIGGLGGFGLELCYWLIERGAINIVVTSRSGIRSGYQRLCLKVWKSRSVNVIPSTLDATDYKQANELLKTASEHGPIGGIFNLALVLKDAFMENQTSENFRLVCQSKVQSTINLDRLTRDICPELDWFVCFSSVSCGRGNAGQSNYGFANSVMERICEQRKIDGYPALAIQWGAIGDVGVIQETISNGDVISGTIPQRIISCLKVFDQFLSHDHPVVSSFVPYRRTDNSGLKTERNALAIVANVFGIKDIINMEATLGELGIDSLMMVEIQQFLERDYDMVISTQDVRHMKMKDFKNIDENLAACGKNERKENLDKIKEENSISNSQLIPVQSLIPLNGVKEGIPLFIVHPMEGDVTMLESVSKLIQCPVYGLQYTADAPSTSLEDLASWYLIQIKNGNFNGPINIAGYSFGAGVAFEIAIQADRNPTIHPEVKSVIMLDGSPVVVSGFMKDYRSHFHTNSQVEGEAHTLCAFVLQFLDTNITELKKQLLELPNLQKRVNYIVEKVITVYPDMSKQDLSISAKLYYNRFLMSFNYTPKIKLHKDIVLLKASEAADFVKKFSMQYDLEKVCSGKITVHVIPGDHKSFIQGESAKSASNIISSIIDT